MSAFQYVKPLVIGLFLVTAAGCSNTLSEFGDNSSGGGSDVVGSSGSIIGASSMSGAVAINNDEPVTYSLDAVLDSGVSNASDMRFSNDGVSWSPWEPYAASRSWALGYRNGDTSVYAEFRDPSGSVLPRGDSIRFIDRVIASDASVNANLGCCVATDSNGSTIVAGAHQDTVGAHAGQGSAYVYRWDGVVWHQTKLTASDGAAGDEFGCAVAISGNASLVAVGAKHAAVGANACQGAVYLYRWDGSSWAHSKLTAFDGAVNDRFGYSVALSSDGNTLVVGACGYLSTRGAVYVYRWSGGSWSGERIVDPFGKADDFYGNSVSVSADGGLVAVGAFYYDNIVIPGLDVRPDQGAVFVYRWNGSAWVGSMLTAAGGKSHDRFGKSVSLSANGGALAIGAWEVDVSVFHDDRGSAYVYRWNGSSWQEHIVLPPDGIDGDRFGSGVSISSDGAALLAGSVYNDIAGNINQGSAYRFEWNGSGYVHTKKLTALDGAAGDCFGLYVSLSADGITSVVGSYKDTVTLSNQGSAYIFRNN